KRRQRGTRQRRRKLVSVGLSGRRTFIVKSAGPPEGSSPMIMVDRCPTRCAGAVATVALAFFLCVALVPAHASASEAKPLGISKFTMQTIENAHVVVNQPIALRKFRLENVPYSPPFTQAGGHPWGLATTVNFATEELAGKVDEHSEEKGVAPTRDPKDIVVDL